MVIEWLVEVWRGGAFYKTVSAYDLSITMSASADIKTSMTCSLRHDPDIDLNNDVLRPILVYDGEQRRMGSFLVATASSTNQGGHKYISIECYDNTILLQQQTTTDGLSFPAGTKYIDAVLQLVTEVGIIRAISDASDLVIPYDLSDWEIGTSYLFIVNELLSAISFGSIYFDRDGVAIIKKPPVASSASVTQVYSTNSGSIIVDGITTESDAFSAFNVFTAVYSPLDGEPLVAVAVNDSPLSPISTVSRGRRINAPVLVVDEVAGIEELTDRVEQIKAQSIGSNETIRFQTLTTGAHWINEIVQIDGNIYSETSWRIGSGSGGAYDHTAERKVFF